MIKDLSDELFTRQEKSRIRKESNVYSLFATANAVVTAHSESAISEEELEGSLSKLLKQYRIAKGNINIEKFIQENRIKDKFTSGYEILTTELLPTRVQFQGNKDNFLTENIFKLNNYLTLYHRQQKNSKIGPIKKEVNQLLKLFEVHFPKVDTKNLKEFYETLLVQNESGIITPEQCRILNESVQESYSDYKINYN
mmetsp:Transcript_2380/g.3460  ORF Transcript_2380/g.3460 Transcript_2380/m.3460 type:complete len:197 (+) Transcript_2380:39-629(+)